MLTLLLVLLTSGGPEQPAPKQTKLEAVLSCAGNPEKCDASDWDLAEKLVRLADPATLAARMEGASDAQRRVLFYALYLGPSHPAVTQVMSQLSGDPDEDIAYYALNYRAKRCEKEALAKLVAPSYKPHVGCMQWATTVSLVGKCHYTPGSEFLVTSLEHACLNIVVAADAGLRKLYPGAPASFESTSQEQEYFRKRMQQQR